MTSQTRENLFMRDDTFFGVCEALGELTRIPSNLFRVALAPLLIWNPVATFIGYCMVGVVLASLRAIFPARRRNVAPPTPIEAVAEASPVLEEIVLAKAA